VRAASPSQALEAVAVFEANDHCEGAHAFMYLTEDTRAITKQDIIDHCRANLAHFIMPQTAIFGELPKISTGKVQKFKLREQVNNLKDDSV
jgi:fatty-acyl-CoA synthase